MEQNEEELVTPSGTYDIDIQPYMFEPLETVDDNLQGDESGNSEESSDDEQQEVSENRMLNTDW